MYGFEQYKLFETNSVVNIVSKINPAYKDQGIDNKKYKVYLDIINHA